VLTCLQILCDTNRAVTVLGVAITGRYCSTTRRNTQACLHLRKVHSHACSLALQEHCHAVRLAEPREHL